MAETTTEVRADIEQTKARMSGAIAELEEKVDLAQKVRDHPWAAIGVAFGAGIALSASRADVKVARVTADATREHGSKLGLALDGVAAAVIAGVAHAFKSRIDGMVGEVVTSMKRDPKPRPMGNVGTIDAPADASIRAD